MEKNSQLGQSWTRGKCIGQGAFGTVNIGVRSSDGGVFAVKSVDLGACRPAQADALENEIRILQSLSSPYIVKYVGEDFTHSPPRRNLHMEYIPGGTVADVAEKDESVVRSRVWCVTSALSHVHSRGVVHCDVKGRNVLLVGSTTAAKLADFGSAVDLKKEEDTCKGRIVPRGSPLWMAPEVIRGEYQGPESDVWSLGCTMIEMLTGKPPWEDEGLHMTIRRVGFSGELPEFPTRLSKSGRDFLDKCLRVDPKSRWSCDQLLRHSFLASMAQQNTAASNSNYVSPRCVLDWVNSEFEDEEEGCCMSHEASSSAKERIAELATNAGADWEFEEGWTVVRGCVVTGELELGAFSREETSWEYSDCGGVFSGDEIVEWARNERDTVGPSGGWYGPSVVEDERSVGKRRSNYYSKKRILLSLTFELEGNNLRSCKMWCICYYVLYFFGDIIKSKYDLIFRVGLDHSPKYTVRITTRRYRTKKS